MKYTPVDGSQPLVIDETKRNELLYGSCRQIAPNCGRLYEKILNSANYEGRQENKRLKSMLGPGQRRGLTLIENCERLGDALGKVRRILPTIAHGFHPGKSKTYHATLCEIVCGSFPPTEEAVKSYGRVVNREIFGGLPLRLLGGGSQQKPITDERYGPVPFERRTLGGI